MNDAIAAIEAAAETGTITRELADKAIADLRGADNRYEANRAKISEEVRVQVAFNRYLGY